MIYNPTTSSNGTLTIYHPTSVSTSNSGATATLSGIESMPTGIMYIGTDSSYCSIAFYVTDENGNEIVNDYSAYSFDDTVTVTYQSATNTLTIAGAAGTYYVFSTNIEEYYIF